VLIPKEEQSVSTTASIPSPSPTVPEGLPTAGYESYSSEFFLLANLLARYEGFYVPGSLAQVNNNPGNLKYVSWSVRKIGLDGSNFAVYASTDDGFMDLYDFIVQCANGGYTLHSFMNQYAPSVENDTNAYIYFLASELEVNEYTLLSDIIY